MSLLRLIPAVVLRQFSRTFAAAINQEPADQSAGEPDFRQGVVLGVYSDDSEKEHKLTPAAAKFNSQTGGRLEELLKEGRHLRRGKYHCFQNLDPEFWSVAVVGLGKENQGYNRLERMDECKETVRVAAAVGAKVLRGQGIPTILVEAFGNAEAAAEGACLGVWRFQKQKSPERQKVVPTLDLYHDEDKDGWTRGIFKAEAQNLARRLSDTAANRMTPTIFAQAAADALCACGVSVEVRDKDWCENRKLNAFLAVARGSCEEPKWVELGYCGGPAEEKPIVFIGKGLTFESGGLCVNQCRKMEEKRGEMSGAAVCVAVMRAVAALSLPINVNAVLPLCENMVSGMTMKPGDVCFTLNNSKTIQIDKTDNEGRIVVADALLYANQAFKPKMLIDVGSLTTSIRGALGFTATGVFTNNDALWKHLEKAGAVTGDRMWRMPLWKHFSNKVSHIRAADMTNVGQGAGSPCRAAAFLREFAGCVDWIHMDTTGKGLVTDCNDYPYLEYNRMSGSPTRTIIQFLYQLSVEQSGGKR